MEFEDMKVIWDSQNEEPLYVLDKDGMRALLDKKAHAFKRLVFWQQAQTYGSTLFTVGVMSIALVAYFTGVLDRLSDNELTALDAVALFVGVGCWAVFGGRVFFSRQNQKERTRDYPDTLKGELDRDIESADFEINQRRNLVLGFIPPYLGSMLFTWVMFRASGTPSWIIYPFVVFMISAMIFETKQQKRLVRRKLIPRKEELESLRDKLVDVER